LDLCEISQPMSFPLAAVTCCYIDPIRSGLKAALIAGSKCTVAAP